VYLGLDHDHLRAQITLAQALAARQSCQGGSAAANDYEEVMPLVWSIDLPLRSLTPPRAMMPLMS
jgi:hypothetical protein